MVQSCPEASPTKWHQAHTTWFFETFVLQPFLAEYRPFRGDFHRLFNRYYLSLGEEIYAKHIRGHFSRPPLDDVLAFRAYVDEEIDRLLSRPISEDISRRILLGLNHEQQHQEMALADIKHAFYSNPLRPSYLPDALPDEEGHPAPNLSWHNFTGGLIEIGHEADTGNP